MKKLLAVCLMALVCWVCAGYAEETRVGDTVMFGQYEQDGNLDNGSEPIAWQVLDVQGGKALLMSRLMRWTACRSMTRKPMPRGIKAR
ncbi:MAG: hypothetical protein ACLTXW_11150 [Christensenellales bacterium]